MKYSFNHPQPQRLILNPGSDDKYWVAEITGPDPIYHLQRVFLPEISANTFEIYDGVYQIHGIHPGISPFNKEFCLVIHGKMERKIPYSRILTFLTSIESEEPTRIHRQKLLVKTILNSIGDEVEHERVQEEMQYQIEQVEDMEDYRQLMMAYSHLIKEKEKIIQKYKRMLGLE